MMKINSILKKIPIKFVHIYHFGDNGSLYGDLAIAENRYSEEEFEKVHPKIFKENREIISKIEELYKEKKYKEALKNYEAQLKKYEEKAYIVSWIGKFLYAINMNTEKSDILIETHDRLKSSPDKKGRKSKKSKKSKK